MSDHFDPDALDLPGEPEPRPRTAGSDVEQMLRRLHDVVASARPMPLSTSVMVNRDEVLDLLDETIERLPDELRAARWLLKEREEYLAKVKREGEDILDQARTRAERMVQRTEVVKAAEARAYQTIDNAEAEARRLHHEVEDFCDQKLASFEIVLERTMKLVASGRQKLQGTNLLGEAGADEQHPLDLPPPPDSAYVESDEGYEDEFYDQDDAS
jgi:hypothetical protein